jgi:hypothetical protein
MNAFFLRGMRSPFGGLDRRANSSSGYGRQSLFGYGGYSGYGGYGGCSFCYEDPLSQDHICQCHEAIQFLEAGRYLECDCLECPFMSMSGYESGIYPGYGRYGNSAFT